MLDRQTIRDALLQAQELARRGMHDAAIGLCRQVVQQAPEAAEGWFALGAVALRGGSNSEAETALRRALGLFPGHAGGWSDLSTAVNRQGKSGEAESCARQAIALAPASGDAWLALANAIFAQQRWKDAAETYRQSLTYDPQNAAAWNNLAAAEQKRGELAAAQEAYERSLSLAPGHPGAVANYACLLSERGEPGRATEVLKDAIGALAPSVETYLLLGFGCQRLSLRDLAEDAYRRAVAIAPRHREARYNLGLVLLDKWSLAEAEALIREVLADDPSYAEAWALFSGILQAESRMDESRAALERAVTLSPDPHRHSRLLLNLQYADDASAAMLLEAHRHWDALYGQPLAPPTPLSIQARSEEKRLRIGFLSADFGQHPTAFLVLPALEHLDKRACSVVCYSDRLSEDQYTARFKAASDVWRVVVDTPPEALAQQIRDDGIDILLDLMGHTGRNHLLVFARRPAPMQVTWFGYVGTTGLEAMDYLLADRLHVRPGEESAYVETVLRMPHGYGCYGAPPEAPEVGPLPAPAAGHVTFGCFNSTAKYSRRTLDAWSAILQRVPAARLLLKYGALDQADLQEWMRGQFARRGIASERILLEGWSGHRDHLAAYSRVDLALDTQPYSGGVTTCEALWMGVPVITCPGPTFASRHSVSHMTNAGYGQFVAADLEGYVELAVQWAGRVDELAVLRAGMREQVRSSPLCDAPRFARDLLSVLRQAWESRGAAANRPETA
jgi:predicted O-linked N-acetylglucosamine transferase (SPINDLY family)